MKLRPLGSNMTELELDSGISVLFSYETPVGIHKPGEGYWITEQHFSATTTRHVNKWLAGARAQKIPQAEIERIAGVERERYSGRVIPPYELPAMVRRSRHTKGGETRRNPPGDDAAASHDPDEAYPHFGKFEGERWLAVQMYESGMESGADESGGDAEGPGYFELFTDFDASDGSKRHGILEHTSQGFVGLDEYDTADEARDAWRTDIEPMLSEWYEEEEGGSAHEDEDPEENPKRRTKRKSRGAKLRGKVDPGLRKRVAFFTKHAGYATPPGRVASALALAKAEQWAAEEDVEFRTEADTDPDLSWMTPEERQQEHEVVYMLATHPLNSVATSLGGIVDADHSYLRVVAAELALDLMEQVANLVGE